MRCFLAIPVNSSLADALEARVQELQQESWASSVHWFPKRNYHLTLQFLGGHLETDKVEQVIKSMDDWFSEGMSFFEADIKKVQLFPDLKKPHTIVASFDATLMLQYLVREIEEHMKMIGLERSKMVFRPHISLGRIKAKSDHSAIHIPTQLAETDALQLMVDRITLYESELTDDFPIYHDLKTIFLERYEQASPSK